MKKTITVLSVLMLLLGAFFGCTAKQTEVTVEKFKLGEEVTSYKNNEGNVIHETDEKNTISVDYYDKEGNLKYIEKYLYSEKGDVIGYTYNDKNGGFVARYIISGEKVGFFYENGEPMTENDFINKMSAIGAIDKIG